MSHKWVYLSSEAEEVEAYTGSWDGVRSLLGGKGANRADLMRTGVPALPGFTVTAEVHNAYRQAGGQFPEGLWAQVLDAIGVMEKKMGKRFGDPANPLVFYCGAGAKFSMPGMMPEIFDVGLNDETVKGLATLTGNEVYAYDLYQRLIQIFGSVVFELPDEEFDQAHAMLKEERGATEYADMAAEDWRALGEDFQTIIARHRAGGFPQDPVEQVKMAIEAAFRHWNRPPATTYRQREEIPHDLGVAVTFVAWVFGNQGDDSGIGNVFTRDPATGEKVLYGDYMPLAHGWDWLEGLRPTLSMAELAVALPRAHAQLVDACARLESHYRDMQDVDFRIDEGKLWVLGTRDGKRAAQAAVKIAVDMANEGPISRDEAILRVRPEQVDVLFLPRFDPIAKRDAKCQGAYLASGISASPGAAAGIAVFDADLAEEWGLAGRDVILVRSETQPDEVHGMIAARGILTSRGGATSDAAIVARQFGIPAVVGCKIVETDLDAHCLAAGDQVVKEGDWLSLDGTTGEVFVGRLATEAPRLGEQPELRILLAWADGACAREDVRTWPAGYEGFPTRGLQIWANVDYPRDVQLARELGAQGIGLCRTEHMFFEQERLPIVQAMILAGSVKERKGYLDKLLPYQRADFEGLFETMKGLPAVIRLLDPPLYEFLPNKDELLIEVTTLRLQAQRLKKKGKAKKIARLQGELAKRERLLQVIEGMEEANLMLGHRGVRLYLAMPEIAQMQVRAILEAACNQAHLGVEVLPRIMIPMVSHYRELEKVKALLVPVAQEVMTEKGIEIDCWFGAMIETPRAALTAGQVAEHAEFFSFGSGDLTKMTFGLSRDDAERNFLLDYVEGGILSVSPFQVLDEDGVGKLIELAVRQGRQTDPELEVGVCGSHAADPDSIEFFHRVGLDYVSCSPFRVPVMRLAAAHAALKHR